MLEKLCLLWLFLQDQSINTESSTNRVYTTEGSTTNFSFKIINSEIDFYFNERSIYHNIDHKQVNTQKYGIILPKNTLEFQKLNVTANDTGIYWIDDWSLVSSLELKITNMSCPPSGIGHVCAIEGSSQILTFIFEGPVYYSTIEEGLYFRIMSRRFRNFTIHVDFQINNVTPRDEGSYRCFMYDFDQIELQVINLWFINQTNLKTIIGQEGVELDIRCSSDTVQYITALKLESNGTIKAIGNNQTVTFSFLPTRTDHMTIYKCLDSTFSSIKIEVKLVIRYAPAIKSHYTNTTVTCEGDGVPATYSVYRLDQISTYGELVRSVNLNTETFTFNTDLFPYQTNGRYECIVSNGIPDINGKVLQTWSTHVKYEGSPVFASENRYLKTGTVGLPIRLSFHIYSCPGVIEVIIENIGQEPSKRKKLKLYNILNSTLLYSQFNNIVGIEGYEILIESEELNIFDFEVYRITAKNRLGESSYHFAIIENENLPLSKSNRRYFVILCIIAAVLFVYMVIIHVWLCVKCVKTRDQSHHNVHEDHNYHTYDEIGTISYHAVRTMRSSDTNDNQGQYRTEQHEVDISTGANLQSTDDDTTELNTDVPDNGLQQRDTSDGQVRRMPISTDDRNLSSTDLSHIQSTDIPSFENILNCDQTNGNAHTEPQSDQQSQTSNGSDSESSQNVMVGNTGDGYENPYQTVLQDHPESHQYTHITIERSTNISFSANLQLTDFNTTELNANFPEDGLQ